MPALSLLLTRKLALDFSEKSLHIRVVPFQPNFLIPTITALVLRGNGLLKADQN
jgi:hypothetical protein